MRSFRLLFLVIIMLVLAVFAAFGQTVITPAIASAPVLAAPIDNAAALPGNFVGAGFGFQSAAARQTSGWAEACHRNPDVTLLGMTLPSYSCAATDYAAAATSARVDVETVFVHKSIFTAGTKTGAGAAMRASGVGASYALGGWGAVDVSKLFKSPGVFLVASATWQKDDVDVATASSTLAQTLRTLGSRATFRFGVGKSW
jgi:hypothetical protein